MSPPEGAAPEKKSRGGSSRKKSAPGADEARKDLARRVPPHSVEAELAVLGGLLTRPELMNSFGDLLAPEDFYLPAHQLIFRAVLDLYAKSAPIDLVAIAERLNSRKELERAGGAVYLGEIAQAVVSGANAEFYAGLVRGKALQRKLIETCAEIIGNCFDGSKEVDELLDESEQAVFAISQRSSRREFNSSKDLIDDVFANLSRLSAESDQVTGVTTGYEKLNVLTAGFQKSDLIIVAARPSMGKTALALCLALNASLKQGVTVGIFSLEMSKEQLMQRMLAIKGRVDLKRIRRPALLEDADWNKLWEAGELLKSAPIFIDDSSALSTMELRAKARRLKAEHNLGMIVVDYLQLMRSSRKTDSRELEISDISRSLKGLAKELNIPVIALSQLNRAVEKREDRRPGLADLRESGAIEQDADVIMFVYREDVYAYKNQQERPDQGVAEIIIGKQRNGPVGVAELTYTSPYTAFDSKAPDYVTEGSESSF